ncbi:MAG: amylosucrase, partial [Treponema sp.]|nr:amylosucrase [Treponema sp.]
KSKKEDSRWVHRIKSDWSGKSKYKSQKMVADFVKKVIALRKGEEMLGGSEIFFYDIQDSRVFAFRRGTIHVVANFSDSPAEFMIDAWSENSTDLLTGRNFWNHQKQLLAPYEVRWLKEIID